MKKALIGLYFISLSFMAAAQLQDDFSDGNFTGSPSWAGNTGDFTVNASGQLQLSAAISGTSYLSTPCLFNSLSDLEWKFFVRQNFSPSSANYGRVYLVSDQVDLSGPLNGYYVQFGEALSLDAVELFRQDGTSSISVCRAGNGQIASAFSLGIKVTRDVIGMWTIWIDANGGTNYVPEISGMEGMYDHSAFFGVQCVYTSGNRSNFFYDDFYAGSIIADTIQPSIVNVNVISSTELDLQFSEPVDIPVSVNPTNYVVDQGIGQAQTAIRDSNDLALVHIAFSSSFPSAIELHLEISGVKDFSGNVISLWTIVPFTYYPPVNASAHDIIFTEIMFEPSSVSGLPNAEFVELLNRSAQPIPMEGWTMSDGSSTATFPALIFQPHQNLIVCSSSNSALFSSYGFVAGLNQFPGLNNDVGDKLNLSNPNGESIDEIIFSDETYHDSNKDGGGWSLERVDTSFLCTDPSNWKASIDILGGTPGLTNSVNGHFVDRASPELIRAFLSDSIHLTLIVSEPLSENLMYDPSNYFIFKEGVFLNQPLAVIKGSNPAEIILLLSFQCDSSIYSLHVNGNLQDCPGNKIDTTRSVRFSFATTADSGDIVINELLFHPDPGIDDFLELYNRSNKVIDLKDWRVAEAAFDQPGLPNSIQFLNTEHILLFPGEYIVFTKNTTAIKQRYVATDRFALFKSVALPDFNSTNGAVDLFDPLGRNMDQMIYSEEMHFPLLTDVTGVSLERISPGLPSSDQASWHSSSASNGFATPGYLNSQHLMENEDDKQFSIIPPVFSPDNDGYHDLLEIRFLFPQDDWEGSVFIYNEEGSLVRTLKKQQLAGSEEIIMWDGCSDRREKAPAGIYIVYAEFFNRQGDVKHWKKACYLASG